MCCALLEYKVVQARERLQRRKNYAKSNLKKRQIERAGARTGSEHRQTSDEEITEASGRPRGGGTRERTRDGRTGKTLQREPAACQPLPTPLVLLQ